MLHWKSYVHVWKQTIYSESSDKLCLRIAKILANIPLRDKFLKVLQYLCRLFACIGRYRKADSTLLSNMNETTLMLSNSRKIFRLFRSIDYLLKIYEYLQTHQIKMMDISQYAELVEHFVWMFFFWYDHIVLYHRVFDTSNSSDAMKANRRFFRAWMYADIIRLFRVLLKFNDKISRIFSQFNSKDLNLSLEDNNFPRAITLSRILSADESIKLISELLLVSDYISIKLNLSNIVEYILVYS